MTRVVNLRNNQFDVYIGRATRNHDGRFGNPFVIGSDGNREEVVRKYREWFDTRISDDREFRQAIESLRNKSLG